MTVPIGFIINLHNYIFADFRRCAVVNEIFATLPEEYNGMTRRVSSEFVSLHIFKSLVRTVPFLSTCHRITTNLKCNCFASQRFYEDLHGGSALEFPDGQKSNQMSVMLNNVDMTHRLKEEKVQKSPLLFRTFYKTADNHEKEEDSGWSTNFSQGFHPLCIGIAVDREGQIIILHI